LVSECLERKLTAILAADVAGYSWLIGKDEEGTHAQLKEHLRVIVYPEINRHRGRIVKNTGDGMLAEFGSVVDAVRCALIIQRGIGERNVGAPREKRIEFRIGINVGDVISDGGDIYGDSVNVAVRLEGIAEPGGICVSGDAHRQIKGKIDFAAQYLGNRRLKNIAEPVQVFAFSSGAKSPQSRSRDWRAVAAAAAAIIVVLGSGRSAVWYQRAVRDDGPCWTIVDTDAHAACKNIFAKSADPTRRHRGIDHYAEDTADLDKILKFNPKYATDFNNRGAVLYARGDLDHAIADYDEALRLDEGYIAAYTARGLAYEAKGERDRAKADYSAALALPHANDTGKWARDKARERLAALEFRVALVIGNSVYQTGTPLLNPTNDANGVAEALRNVGFKRVQVVTDATRDAMIQALRAFKNDADMADWAVVFYAGRGVESDGIHYLVPTDAHIERHRDVQDEAVSLSRILEAVGGAKKLRLVLLDDCREDPPSEELRRVSTGSDIGRGFNYIRPKGATLVFYATKDGEIAEDGIGEHSPFTASLVKRLKEPDIEISKLVRLVTSDVLQSTSNRQQPFVYGSIPNEEEFFFKVSAPRVGVAR